MTDSQVWLITGASRGMGAAFTSAVLAAGHSVVATARRPAEITDMFAPSEGAREGSGWVSTNTPSAPAATAARASAGMNSGSPPLALPPPPGSWTAWVAS